MALVSINSKISASAKLPAEPRILEQSTCLVKDKSIAASDWSTRTTSTCVQLLSTGGFCLVGCVVSVLLHADLIRAPDTSTL